MAHDPHARDPHASDDPVHDAPAEPGADTGPAHRPAPPVPNPPGEAPLATGHLHVPDAPEPRMIPPARDEYLRVASGPGLLWPAFWLLVAVGFAWTYRHESARGPVVVGGHEADAAH